MSRLPVNVETIETDVAVIGSGGAGLMCVLHALDRDPSLRVTLVSKGIIGRSGCTVMVQGGYNAVLDPRDSLDLHYADTLKGGGYINDQELAWTLVEDAPRVIHELETRVGCFFDRNPDGTIHQKAFAAQNFSRTIHRGDQTGIEIMGRLRDQMFRLGPRELPDMRALDLLLDGEGGVVGVTLLNVRTGELSILRARVVVVATGGSATMYKIAAPAREKTGDGVAMCYRAGLEMRDMEMLQFHPTGLLAGESRLTGTVLEEGLRGAGAYLYNGLGERFMERYDPERFERSTRDVIARASYMEIMAGRGTEQGGVYLDISHLGVEEVERSFSGMVARSRQIGRDLARAPVEVCPTSHYHMGGVIIDRDCRTSIRGLLVAGEDSGGSHGANRLGGNGVAESLVYGARAGDRAVIEARECPLGEIDRHQAEESFTRAYAPLRQSTGPSPFDLTRELKDVMWRDCGLVRSREGLLRASEVIRRLAAQADEVCAPGPASANYAWQESLDVRNQLVVARMMVESALLREESRGAHYRSDFPNRDDAEWLSYIVNRRGLDGEPQAEIRPVQLTRARPEGVAAIKA